MTSNNNDSPIVLFDGGDQEMLNAYLKAQDSFRFFWRELSWERMRIVPALDMALIKLPFTDGKRSDGKPEYEHMWIDNIDFDGDYLSGNLVNSPNWIKSAAEGDFIRVPFDHLEDWMMTTDRKAFGAYTVNIMRAKMSPEERKSHDQAWDLDFGDPMKIRIDIHEKSVNKNGLLSKLFKSRASETHTDHPMCTNMLEKIETQLKDDASITASVFENGFTLLHQHALAGNFGVVKLLVKYGAGTKSKTSNGYNAKDLAEKLSWNEIAEYLEQ